VEGGWAGDHPGSQGDMPSGGRSARASSRWVVELGMVVQVSCPSVDGHKGASDGPIHAIFGVKSADVNSVNDPREAGALAEGAVNANAVWEVPFWWQVEGDRLTVTKPHGKVGDCCLLLLQPGCEIPVVKDERVGLVN
jgi:hypothetical protein